MHNAVHSAQAQGDAKMRNLYQRLTEAGIETDHHESDLYVRATPEAFKILREEKRAGCYTFRSQLDGKLWVDVPFAYQPFWDAVQNRSQLEAAERAWAKGDL